jgi:acetyl-CoA carboxylase carboxyltransferase component
VIDTDAAAMVLISSVETDITEPVAVVNTPDLDRSDIRHNETRHAQTLDAARPQAVAKRHARGKRTARENIADLLDENSFHENGALTIAAQRSRRTIDDLEANTPADGVVTGFGTVDGVPVAVLAYDYSVLAGTQGLQGHKKAERLFTLAARRRAPVVIFAEGGGGRPGDTDNLAKATGMDLATFVALGRLNGQVPTVAIASGRCFAGNAALVGMCDVVIATSDTNLGLGGPAMIEGGGLGIVRSEEIGPLQTQYANGVVDVAVTDEAEATEAARRHLSYFTHPVIDRRSCSDQAQLRTVIPERRTRTFDIRTVVATVSDTDSVFELRAGFGLGMVTALARIEGRAVGMVANNGAHRGGAIGADEADKAARFLQLCDAHQVPVVTLCDTPGFMVGPDSERTATVRHVARLFVLAPNLRVPLCTVIIRKSYGLGGQAMAGGSFRVPDAIVAWPTAELGAMGPEGAVQLGFRRELEQIDDPAEHARVYQGYLDDYERQGKPANAASVFEIDDVIDPSETRSWISTTFAGHDRSDTQPTRVRIDTW